MNAFSCCGKSHVSRFLLFTTWPKNETNILFTLTGMNLFLWKNDVMVLPAYPRSVTSREPPL